MNHESGVSTSLWHSSTAIGRRAPVTRDFTQDAIDVCVVGAGISGLTAAYLLLKAGRSVMVVDQGRVGGGDTGRTTAHLSSVIDDGLAQMEKWHGSQGPKSLRAIAESHGAAIDQIEAIVKAEKIECDFLRVEGFLFAGDTTSPEALRAEFDAAKRADYDVSTLDQSQALNGRGPMLRFKGQAQFHALKYLQRLAEVVEAWGGKIYEHTSIEEIQFPKNQPAELKTSDGKKILAKAVVEASNSLVSGSVRTITKLYPYRTYAIAAEVSAGAVKPALFWDMEDPYHYVRVQPGTGDARSPDWLIVGGEDHKTGQADDADVRYERLEQWARRRWPQMGAVKFRWSGQILETPDGLGLLGRNPGNPDNSYLITGDSGHGITHGTLGAMIVADMIQGRENPYAEIYTPSRFTLMAAKEWVRENVNVAAQYLDWVPGLATSDVEKLQPGEGAVVQQGLSKIAVYKNPDGKLSACSAVCTHLGGIVSWNSGEKTWDCPCHGSRFSAHGKVIATPAVTDLETVELDAESRKKTG